jgi:hypothetical protein
MRNFNAFYFSGDKLEEKLDKLTDFDYSEINAVRVFNGTHPRVMEDMVNRLNWHVQIDERKIKYSLKDYLLFLFEKKFGYRLFEYKNYRIIP